MKKNRLLDLFYNPETGSFSTIEIDEKLLLTRKRRIDEYVKNEASDCNVKMEVKYNNDTCVKEPILIAVMDSGYATNHPSFTNKIFAEKDFTGEGIEDLSGHGTMVLLQLVENLDIYMAGEYRIVLAKVLNQDALGFQDEVIEGIKWISEFSPYLVNISFGFQKEDPCNDSCVLCKMINEYSREKQIIFMAAAGNDPSKYYCPASATECMSIGANRGDALISGKQGAIGYPSGYIKTVKCV